MTKHTDHLPTYYLLTYYLLTTTSILCASTISEKYKSGKIHGLYREWANGILIVLGCYIYGKIENKWEEYYVDGGLRIRRNYLDGKQHGNEINYYFNGKIKNIKRYVLGHHTGIEKEFNIDGTLKYIERWKNDTKHGLATYYSSNNLLTKTVNYFYGSIMYSCIHDKNNITKKIEDYYTPIGKIKIHRLQNLKSICIYTGDFTYEYEKITEGTVEYVRFYFSELKGSNKETSFEYMIYNVNDIENQTKTLILDNIFKIQKTDDMIYYSVKATPP